LRPPQQANPRCNQILAIGFLLVILSAALFKNYLTLLVVATYVIAPLPNWICGRAANQDDFMETAGSGVVDFGRFLTGFFVVMGIGKLMDSGRAGRCAPMQAALGNTTQTNCPHSSPYPPLALGADCRWCCGHVGVWRSAHLRHHHQLHAVLPGGPRLLTSRRKRAMRMTMTMHVKAMWMMFGKDAQACRSVRLGRWAGGFFADGRAMLFI
jgi:hypothetical protein